MKLLWRLSREPSRYKGLYPAATPAAPKLLSAVADVVEGRVVERGAHAALVALDGMFARMNTIQGGGEAA